jgi:hypothetical protein
MIDEDTVSFQTKVGETYFIANIPQDKLFSDPREFMNVTVENLYHTAIFDKIEAPSKEGAYIDVVSEDSFAAILGFEQYDFIVSVNDQTLKDTNEFMRLYDKYTAGDIIKLKIWRNKSYQSISFVKSPYDNYKILPGKIEVEDYDELYGNGMKTESCGEGGENLGFIAGGDYVVFQDIKFKEIPVKFNIRTAGTSGNKITLRIDGIEGPIIAELNVSPTGEWQTYVTNTSDIMNAELLEGGHDLYLILNAGMNVNWISFDSEGELMPDMDVLLLKNELINLLEECRSLSSQDSSEESLQLLNTVIQEIDAKLKLNLMPEELKNMLQSLEDARSSLKPAAKETVAPVKENNFQKTLPYIIIAFVLLIIVGITVVIIINKKKGRNIK